MNDHIWYEVWAWSINDVINHVMLTSHVNFHNNPMCCNHFTKLKPITGLTHSFSTKGIFCLYREGMSLGANGKNLLNELAHTGDSTGHIAHPTSGQGA